MELQVGVKAVARNKEGNYLFLRRSEKSYPGAKGIWDIVGGRIDPKTSLRENLIREIHEETGLVFNGEMKLIGAQDIFPDSGDRHVVRLTYLIELDGIPVINPEEHEEFMWITEGKLRALEGLDVYVKELVDKDILRDA